MALREILSHQGASAGVFMPEFSSDGASLVEVEDEYPSYTIKREREIDLNMQIPTYESESSLKRPKFENVSSPWVDTMVPVSNNCIYDISLKVEGDGSNLPYEPANCQFNASSVKVEPESYPDAMWVSSKEAADTAEPKDFSSSKVSLEKKEMLKNLADNYELMNFVKLARHSWLKNCEFLQDCAIRFLCVLSLDRYGFVFLLSYLTTDLRLFIQVFIF